MFVLQHLVWPRRLSHEPLYAHSSRPIEFGPAGVTIGPRQTVGFDSYFNSLFEAHWLRLTAMPRFHLRLRIVGELSLRVARTTAHAGDVTLTRRRIGKTGHESEHVVAIAAEMLEPLRGRIHFELTSGGAGAALCDGAWLIDEEQVRDRPRLDLVICTFRREREVTSTVEDVLKAPALRGLVNRVIIVDNGRTLLPSTFSDRRVTLVSQANLGGAGGFARGMMASLEDPASTHCVLMDDDVALDPESLYRISSAFAVMAGDWAISGALLDELRPTRLCEAGAERSKASPFAIASHYGDVDLATKSGLFRTSEPVASTYGAWWLFAFSKRALRRAGLPMPFFLHVDDIEFSLRLGEAGCGNVPLPGIAVWHHPAVPRLGTWMHYYDYRNHLICDAYHPLHSRFALWRTVTAHLVGDLLRFDYQKAALVTRAVEDFLSGPECLTDPAGKHAEVVALAEAHAPRTVEMRGPTLEPLLEPSVRPKRSPLLSARGLWRLATLNGHLRPAVSTVRPAVAVRPSEHRWDTVGPEGIAVAYRFESKVALYQRKPREFWAVSARAAAMSLKFLLAFPVRRRDWQARRDELASAAHWRRIFERNVAPHRSFPAS